MHKPLLAFVIAFQATAASAQAPDNAVPGHQSGEEGASNAFWVAPERDDGRSMRERYWQATVLVRGPIAVVWAPYEFWIDGETSHCGVDVFGFVKTDGRWLVSNSMWTVEPEACESLRPADAGAVRPGG